MEEIDERKVENQETEEVKSVEEVKEDKKKDPPRTGGGTGSLD